MDAARPESLTARDFNAAVDRIVAKRSTQQDAQFVRGSLLRWSNLNERLKPAYNRHLMKEIQPIAADLSQAAAAGLQALDSVQKGNASALDQMWKSEQLAAIQDAKKPQAQVLIMVLPGIEKLIQALP